MRISELLIQVLNIFTWILLIRLILDYVRMFKPGWRPRGLLLPLAEIIYTLTDKPLGFVRRFVPPLQLGPVALDQSRPLTPRRCRSPLRGSARLVERGGVRGRAVRGARTAVLRK